MIVIICPKCGSDNIEEMMFGYKCADCGHEDGLAGFETEERGSYI